jgi:hypothetical protein
MPASLSALRGGLKPGYIVVQVTGLVTPALGSDQLGFRTIEFAGTLAGPLTVTFNLSYEDQGLIWEIFNNTVGSFPLAVQGPGSAPVPYTIPQSTKTQVLFDGVQLGPAESGIVTRSDQTILSGITGNSPTRIVTPAEALSTVLIIQGNATGTPIIQVPSNPKIYLINNQIATGISVKTATGNAAPVPPSSNHWIFIDLSLNAGAV